MSTDTTGTDTFDEFSFLPEQAQELGGASALPRGERVSLTLEDGRHLSALRYGEGAPVVTFLHGAGLNAHTWDTTILALGLPALSIDLPGHGDSSWRSDIDYSPRTLAPDVAAGIAAWTETPQLVVGQSLGGLTAAAVAASRPDLISEVIVVDITPGIDTVGRPLAAARVLRGPDRLGDTRRARRARPGLRPGRIAAGHRARRVLQLQGAPRRTGRVEAPLRAPRGRGARPGRPVRRG